MDLCAKNREVRGSRQVHDETPALGNELFI